MNHTFLGRMFFTLATLATLVPLLPLLSSCGPHLEKTAAPAQATTKNDAGNARSGNTGKIPLANGASIPVIKVNGSEFVEIEGILSPEYFQKIATLSAQVKRDSVEAKINRIKGALNGQTFITQVSVYPELGFFSAWASLERLGNTSTPGKFRDGKQLLKTLFPRGGQDRDLILATTLRSPTPEPLVGGPRIPHIPYNSIDGDIVVGGWDKVNEEVNKSIDHSGFSGLSLMRVAEFTKKVEEDLGPAGKDLKVNGSTVKLGITDTGITLNHPTFHDNRGRTRIAYLKDFTGEGRMYFSKNASFNVRLPTAEDKLAADVDKDHVLFLDADNIPPAKGINRPNADEFNQVKNKMILVSPELKALLLTPDHGGARLGAMSETSFSSEDEGGPDINQNGKMNDVFWALYFPAGPAEGGQDRLYIDFYGDFNFEKTSPLTDWNLTKRSMALHAERIGFVFDQEDLPLSTSTTKDPKSEKVYSASMVGFDPGSHGSHVAGIAAGGKIISNDEDGTMAHGVAPMAQIYLDRVCANNGGCIGDKAIIDLAKKGVDLINMSLGGLSSDNDGYDPQSLLIDRLSQVYQTQFFISAGNEGPGQQTVGSPSVSRFAISVGAAATPDMVKRQLQYTALPPYKTPVEGSGEALMANNANQDFLLYFSSRGPTAAGGFKPNVTAPGTQLSSVPFNSPPNSTQAGLASFWGTSMASPAASGAYALFLDAARKYNQVYPLTPLPTDPYTLKQVLIESARPYSVKDGLSADAQYTWIDQGTGMINLAAAWELLKSTRDSVRHPTFFMPEKAVDSEGTVADIDGSVPAEGAKMLPVQLDYEVKASQEKNRYEQPYNGTGETPKFARGLWPSYHSDQSLYQVSIRRNLPENLLQRGDAGGLLKVLRDTSEDLFKIRIVTQGSSIPWVKLTDNQVPCGDGGPLGKDEVLVSSLGENSWSTLNVCLDRVLMKSLPAGDHGVLIKGYRSKDGQTDGFPSFIIPVYLNVPHQILAKGHPFELSGSVRSFEVKKHYVEVPKGLSMLKVTLTVPAAEAAGDGSIKGCSGLNFAVYEGSNIKQPAELAGRGKASVKSCDEKGNPTPELNRITYQRMNPNPGIWDLHTLGLFRYPFSAYTIKVDYGMLKADISEIKGTPEKLKGDIRIDVQESTAPLIASNEKSQFFLNAMLETTALTIHPQESQIVPGSRQYASGIASVAFKTGNATGNSVDIDLYVYECKDDHLDVNEKDCSKVGQSTGSSFEEEVKFTPKEGKFYFAKVDGFSTPEQGTKYDFTEVRTFKDEDKGGIVFNQNDGKSIFFSHEMKESKLVTHPDFLSGKVSLSGEIQIKAEDDNFIALIPVSVTAPPSAPTLVEKSR